MSQPPGARSVGQTDNLWQTFGAGSGELTNSAPGSYNFNLNGRVNNFSALEEQLTCLGVDEALHQVQNGGAMQQPSPLAVRQPLVEVGGMSRLLMYSPNTMGKFSPASKGMIQRYNMAVVDVMENFAKKLKNDTDVVQNRATSITAGASNESSGSQYTTNVFTSQEHYDNVKRWIGESVSTFIATTKDTSLYLSDNEYKEVVKDHPEIKSFMTVHDVTGQAFDAFWVFDEKVHGKTIASRTGGLITFKTRFNSQIGQASMKSVSYIELSKFKHACISLQIKR